VALYAQALDAETIQQHARQVPQPDAVVSVKVTAEVLAVSPAWTLDQIQPYDSGLSSVRVRIVESDEDALRPGDLVSVPWWSLLNREALPLPEDGDRVKLTLEPFEAWGHLKDKPLQDEAADLMDPRWFPLPPRD
jgi:hypothetical protein